MTWLRWSEEGNIPPGLNINPGNGLFTLSGQPVTMIRPGQFTLNPGTGLYHLTGSTSTLIKSGGGAGAPLGLFFNSLEAGGDGSDPDVLLADDFSRGYWYLKDADHIAGYHGIAPGWGGTIFANTPHDGNGRPLTPDGAVRPVSVSFQSSGFAASQGVTDGSIGSGYMAWHNLSEVVTELYIRYYRRFSAGYLFSGEKDFTLNREDDDSGIWWANINMNAGQGSLQSTGTYTLTTGSGALSEVGASPVNLNQNQGNDLSCLPGHWYYLEHYIKLNTNGNSDGIYKFWLNDGGVSGVFTGSPILRTNRTGVNWGKRAGGSAGIGSIWPENWANNGDGSGSIGEKYLAKLKVSKAGPIGF